jgi:hypothetical protein
MAESVKRRVAAARLTVAFVAAGTIAGATAWAQASPPPPTAQSSAVDAFHKHLKLTGADIIDGSLFYKDFKAGEVVSGDTFAKFKKAEINFKKAVNGDLKTIKGELNGLNGDLSTIKGELGGFVKTGDAIMGDGSVFTASKPFSANSLVGMLNVPDLITVDTLAGGGGVLITNISVHDISVSTCTALVGGGGGGNVTLKPGESTSCATGQHTEAVQMIGGVGGSEVITLNFTKISGNITVQVLIGL